MTVRQNTIWKHTVYNLLISKVINFMNCKMPVTDEITRAELSGCPSLVVNQLEHFV